jgi:maltose alpha-D-glucosyltransferase/alpha-amylase
MPRSLWYKDAIIYCLDVETFQDADGDGVGDFAGLRRRLDHLVGLGVSCVWLLPFYPTPNRDNGYDVTDYYGVDPRLGTAGDFVEFMRAARERGLRVIVDLPVNHTSVEHPWFERARRDADSRYHDYYVWSDERPEDADEGVIFPGVQEETWTYDRVARQYYFHRFYAHQPDLNIANPEVREEIRRIMGFWLELGVSGFRLDAAPFLIELKGIDGAGDQDPYEYLREFREFLSWRRGDAILLAEANVSPRKVVDYFGDGTRMHMLFNFTLNQHLFLALARQDRTPLVKGLFLNPPIPDEAQWANFLRNHDELDLGRLTDVQRREVFDAFAPEPEMRLYDRGIRRRLAPMLDGDEDRLRMAHSLMLTLPGTPVLRYGEEIGMGDDLSLEERNAVRTAMQWTAGRNGGFSSAKSDQLPRPAIADGDYGYEAVNVESGERDADSLLNWVEHALRARRRCPELGHGEVQVLEADHDAVFAHACANDRGAILAVHNLAGEPLDVRIDTSGLEGDALVDVLGTRGHRPLEPRTPLTLERYGFRWLRIVRGDDVGPPDV